VLSPDNKHVFIVDFGLAKRHMTDGKKVVPQRKKADFRGTVSFASLNAHNNVDLSRRDDIWSLYFVILDFLNEKLKWREKKEYTMDEVKLIKTRCLSNPDKFLWEVTKNIPEVKNIFYHIKRLEYADKPDYQFIRDQLKSISERHNDVQRMITMPPIMKRQQHQQTGVYPNFEFRTPERPKDFGLMHGGNEEAFPRVSPMMPNHNA